MAVFLPQVSKWAKQLAQRTGCSKGVTQPSSEMATLPGWTGQTPSWMECSSIAGVGAVPPGMVLSHCIYHAKERAAMPHAKMPPLPPDCSGWGHSPSTAICMRPAGFYRWRDHGSGQKCLPWTVSSGTEYPAMPTPRPVNGGPPWWAGPTVMEGWSPQCTTSSGRSQSRGSACSHVPLNWPHSSSQSPVTIIRNQQEGRHHSPTASCRCSTVHPSQSPSTGSTWRARSIPIASPRDKGWTSNPLTSKTQALWSHQHQVVTWGSSCQWGAFSIHACRHSYSRGRQQWHQSPPRRGPTQDRVHSRTPSRRSPRHVSPSLSLSYPQHRDQVVKLLSQLPLPGATPARASRGRSWSWPRPEITLVCTTWCSHSPEQSTVECLPRSPTWKHVCSSILQMILAMHHNCLLMWPEFLEWPEDATNEWGDVLEPIYPLWLHVLLYNLMTTMPKREGNQQCSTTAGKARPKSGTASSIRSTAASGARPEYMTPYQTQSNGQRTGSRCICCKDEGTT